MLSFALHHKDLLWRKLVSWSLHHCMTSLTRQFKHIALQFVFYAVLRAPPQGSLVKEVSFMVAPPLHDVINAPVQAYSASTRLLCCPSRSCVVHIVLLAPLKYWFTHSGVQCSLWKGIFSTKADRKRWRRDTGRVEKVTLNINTMVIKFNLWCPHKLKKIIRN